MCVHSKVHTRGSRHLNTTKSVIHLLSGPLQYTAFQPLLWFLSFFTIALLWSFYIYYTRSSSTKTPDPLIPRWVNCTSCPWPQPFVAITPDFLRGPDLIWPYQSHYTAPFCRNQRELCPFRPRDCVGWCVHTHTKLKTSTHLRHYTTLPNDNKVYFLIHHGSDRAFLLTDTLFTPNRENH